jgi:hypothetical protein
MDISNTMNGKSNLCPIYSDSHVVENIYQIEQVDEEFDLSIMWHSCHKPKV